MPAQMVPRCENAARGAHFGQPQRQCDEAVRTGAIGAAAMIYAAHALGLGFTPIIGFDAEAVAYEFALAADEVPVMLLSVWRRFARISRRSRAVRWSRCWDFPGWGVWASSGVVANLASGVTVDLR